jgi:hypothetical protein
MFYRSFSTLTLALLAALPATAQAGNDIYDTAFVRGETSGSYTVVVSTTTGGSDTPARVSGTYEAGDGKPPRFEFSPAGSTVVGTADLGFRPSPKESMTLEITNAEGKTVGTYS